MKILNEAVSWIKQMKRNLRMGRKIVGYRIQKRMFKSGFKIDKGTETEALISNKKKNRNK